MTVDVAVIGGGPSGTAAAITLARAGLNVTVVERTAYDIERIGETFPPEICVPLQRLGVWEQFRGAGHLESPGIVSAWGSAQPFEKDFVFNPYGCGWHVSRARFDRMLADAAREAGAEVWLATRARRPVREPDGRWTVQTERAGRARTLHADCVIDATGRAGLLAPDSPRRRRLDRLVGCAAFFSTPGARDIDETRAVIEACRDGWWYSTSLPGSKSVLVFMTDADLLPPARSEAIAHVSRRLRESELSRRGLHPSGTPDLFRRFAADTYWRPASSIDTLATGDAAMAFDPLSSQGVLQALVSGQRAASAVLAVRAGDESAPHEYSASLAREFRIYWEARSHFYRAEQRWPTSPFWQRRHHPRPLDS